MYKITQDELAELSPDQRRTLRRICTIDRPEIIVRLLKEHGLTPSSFARRHGFPAGTVYACIKGERPAPQIRTAISMEVGFPEEVLFADAGSACEAA